MSKEKSNIKVKDHVDDDTLDLSLCGLSTIPVKDIASLKKIKILDLACNALNYLPDEFCTLTHLVKIDLSKNGLVQLPVEFGRLTELQHLDLFNNELTTLPITMSSMKKLRWLDLKDNKFELSWRTVTGDCLNDKECAKCAISVVGYLTAVKQQEEVRQAEDEKKEKEQEALAQEQEVRERAERRREKQAEKERRRQAWQQEQQQRQQQPEQSGAGEEPATTSLSDCGKDVVDSTEKARGWSCCTSLVCALFPVLASMLALVVLVFVLHGWCARDPDEPICVATSDVVQPFHDVFMLIYKKFKLPNRVFAN